MAGSVGRGHGHDSVSGVCTSKQASLMTGREWYMMRWNAAPWASRAAQDGLCTFLQPDKTTSGQNRISLQLKEESQLVPVSSLVFSECHVVLMRALSCFQNDFHLSWEGLIHMNYKGTTAQCWNASKCSWNQPKRKKYYYFFFLTAIYDPRECSHRPKRNTLYWNIRTGLP